MCIRDSYQTPEYLASTKILVMEPLGDNASNVNNLNDKELAETYMQLLTTQPILESVSQKVGVTVRKTQIKATRCLLYTSPSPRDRTRSRMPSSA